MSELGKSFPMNTDKVRSEAGSESTSSLGVSFPVNVDKLKSELGGEGSGGETSPEELMQFVAMALDLLQSGYNPVLIDPYDDEGNYSIEIPSSGNIPTYVLTKPAKSIDFIGDKQGYSFFFIPSKDFVNITTNGEPFGFYQYNYDTVSSLSEVFPKDEKSLIRGGNNDWLMETFLGEVE